MYRDRLKRLFDLLTAVVAIVIFAPGLVVISILIYFNLGSPIFFIQQRPGLHNKPFNIYKFRTMSNKYGQNGKLLDDVYRMTRLGHVLRSTSLDELPELINVLKGDMSLVGPRPLLMQYLPRYTSEQLRRHDVKPGITGWAQINGRNALSWEAKFLLDVWYVDNYSFLLDVKILILTLWKVAKREGISPKDDVTMSEFTGNNF